MRNRKVKGSQQLWRRLSRKINTFVIKLIRPSTAILGMPYMFCVSRLKGSTCIVFQIIANYILVLFVQRTKIKVTKHYLIPFNNKGYRKKWNLLFCPLLAFVLFDRCLSFSFFFSRIFQFIPLLVPSAHVSDSVTTAKAWVCLWCLSFDYRGIFVYTFSSLA